MGCKAQNATNSPRAIGKFGNAADHPILVMRAAQRF